MDETTRAAVIAFLRGFAQGVRPRPHLVLIDGGAALPAEPRKEQP
jgi:hypothetical protein